MDDLMIRVGVLLSVVACVWIMSIMVIEIMMWVKEAKRWNSRSRRRLSSTRHYGKQRPSVAWRLGRRRTSIWLER